MQNDIALLDIMLKDQNNQRGLYHPGPLQTQLSSLVSLSKSSGVLTMILPCIQGTLLIL